MKRILILLIIGACAMSCTRTNSGASSVSHFVPSSKYFGIEDLRLLCNSDSVHNKAIIFTNPYCSGCRHEFKEYLNPIIEEIDTSIWKLYYLLVVDSTDTINYNGFMADCFQMGIDTNKAYIWKLGSYSSDYNRVFSLFKSIHPLENSIMGIPRMILLDRNNYMAVQRKCYIDNRDSFWFEPMDLDIQSMALKDFSIEDTSWYLMVSK